MNLSLVLVILSILLAIPNAILAIVQIIERLINSQGIQV